MVLQERSSALIPGHVLILTGGWHRDAGTEISFRYIDAITQIIVNYLIIINGQISQNGVRLR